MTANCQTPAIARCMTAHDPGLRACSTSLMRCLRQTKWRCSCRNESSARSAFVVRSTPGSWSRLRKLVAFDDDTLDKLTQLARDRMATFQELADEAFADLLEKNTGIPIDLKDALRKSAGFLKASGAEEREIENRKDAIIKFRPRPFRARPSARQAKTFQRRPTRSTMAGDGPACTLGRRP